MNKSDSSSTERIPEFHTIQEEGKVVGQIEELFNKRKKSELCIYAQHFSDPI